MCDNKKLICPQCLSCDKATACFEAGCPGVEGFVPREWQRPLHDITQDLTRYEQLILDADAHFENPGRASNIALRLCREAQVILAKRKKEGAAEATKTPQEGAPAEEPESLVLE